MLSSESAAIRRWVGWGGATHLCCAALAKGNLIRRSSCPPFSIFTVCTFTMPPIFYICTSLYISNVYKSYLQHMSEQSICPGWWSRNRTSSLRCHCCQGGSGKSRSSDQKKGTLQTECWLKHSKLSRIGCCCRLLKILIRTQKQHRQDVFDWAQNIWSFASLIRKNAPKFWSEKTWINANILHSAHMNMDSQTQSVYPSREGYK